MYRESILFCHIIPLRVSTPSPKFIYRIRGGSRGGGGGGGYPPSNFEVKIIRNVKEILKLGKKPKCWQEVEGSFTCL